MLPLVVLYSSLLVCAAFFAWIAWKYDFYDREPPKALFLALVLGALFMWTAGRTQVLLINLVADHAYSLAGNPTWACFAGITEEVAKLFAVAVVLIVFRPHFNDPIDGLIYGSFAGLGAAIEESIWHLGFDGSVMLLPGQEPVRLAGHLVMGGIGGAGLGAFVMRRSWAWVLASLAGASFLHIAWDVVAFDAADVALAEGKPRPWHVASGVVLMFAGMVVFRYLVTRCSRWSKAHFDSQRIPCDRVTDGIDHSLR